MALVRTRPARADARRAARRDARRHPRGAPVRRHQRAERERRRPTSSRSTTSSASAGELAGARLLGAVGRRRADRGRRRRASTRCARSTGDDPLFKTGAVKLMVDGVIESHTAAMLAPYANSADQPARPNFTPEELDRHRHDVRQAGLAGDDPRDRRRRDPHGARRLRARRERSIPRRRAAGGIASSTSRRRIPPTSRASARSASSPRCSRSTATRSPSQINVWSANIGPERASRGWVYGTASGSGGRASRSAATGRSSPLDPRIGLQHGA